MKTSSRIFLMCLCLFLVLTTQIFAHQGQEHKTLEQAMQTANALVGESSHALKENDYFTTAVNLMELAKTFRALETITPAKGSKNEWDMIHGDLIHATFKAIGACGEKDGETVRLYIQQIAEFMKEGHSIFR